MMLIIEAVQENQEELKTIIKKKKIMMPQLQMKISKSHNKKILI